MMGSFTNLNDFAHLCPQHGEACGKRGALPAARAPVSAGQLPEVELQCIVDFHRPTQAPASHLTLQIWELKVMSTLCW